MSNATVLILDNGDMSVPGAPPPPSTNLATGGHLELSMTPVEGTVSVTGIKLWRIDGTTQTLVQVASDQRDRKV